MNFYLDKPQSNQDEERLISRTNSYIEQIKSHPESSKHILNIINQNLNLIISIAMNPQLQSIATEILKLPEEEASNMNNSIDKFIQKALVRKNSIYSDEIDEIVESFIQELSKINKISLIQNEENPQNFNLISQNLPKNQFYLLVSFAFLFLTHEQDLDDLAKPTFKLMLKTLNLILNHIYGANIDLINSDAINTEKPNLSVALEILTGICSTAES